MTVIKQIITSKPLLIQIYLIFLQKFYKIKAKMILKIEFENFFSIRDRVRIDFRAASINTVLARELNHNVMEWKGVPVLKTVGLFGPNASGKSNILKAITFCCRMILESHLYNEGATFNFEPFKFDGWQDKSSKFVIDFVCDDVEYEYAFELTRERIISESLYHYPVGTESTVLVLALWLSLRMWLQTPVRRTFS